MRHSLVIALIVVGFAERAHAQLGPVRDHRVSFQYGTADGRGFQSADIAIKYRFGICGGDIKLQLKLVPSSLSTSKVYFYKGARQVPGSTTFQRTTLEISGQALLGGRILHDFRLYVWGDSDYGGVCMGMKVGMLSEHLDKQARRKPREVEAFLGSLSVTTEILPALTDGEIERAFDREDRERERQEQEARERERREKEAAERRAAQEAEARRRREAEELEARRREERARQEEERKRRAAEEARSDEEAQQRSEELRREEQEQRQAESERAEVEARAAEAAANRRAAEQRAAEERKRSEEREAEARRVRDAEQRASEDAARRERATRANHEARVSSPEARESLGWFLDDHTQPTQRVNSVVYEVTASFGMEGIMWARRYGDDTRYEHVRWTAIEAISAVEGSDRTYVGYITRSGDQVFEYITPASGVSADDVREHLITVASSVALRPIKGTQMTLRDADQVYLEQQLSRGQASVSPMTAATVQAMDDIIAMTDGGPFPKVWELALSYEQRGGVVGGGVTVRRGGLVYVAFGVNYFEMPSVELTVSEVGKEIAHASNVGWNRTAIEGGFGLSVPLGRWGLLRGEGLMYAAMATVDSNPTIADVTVDEASFGMLGFNLGAHLSFRPRSSPVGVAVFARAHSSGRWGMREIDRQTLSDFRTRELTMSELGWYATFGVALVFGD